MKLNELSLQVILVLALFASAENVFGQAPSNDLCANAISVAIPSSTSGNTTLATAETVPNCGSAFGIAAGNGVWYTVVGTGQKLTASVCGTASFDTQIAVYTGTCGSLVCVDGNDDFCSSQSSVSWCSTNATPYLVIVYGAFSIDKGSFILNISTQNVAQPAAFTVGPTAICRPHSNVTYTIPNDPTVTYNWSYSGTGASITGSTNSVTVSYSASATSGNLSVTATNGCTTSTARTLAIAVSSSVPPMPGAFDNSVASVCQSQNNVPYSVPNDPTVAYSWSYSGTGATISGSTFNVLVNFNASATSGNISVTATNVCGTGPARVMAITMNTPPAQPGTITGNTVVCSGTANAYSIAAVGGATSYSWGLPSGWTPNPASTTTSINVTTSSTGGSVSVYAISGTCTSVAQTLTVASGVPPTPGSITGNAAACSGAPTTYSVAAVTGATSYTWSQPTGWTGTSTTNSTTYSAVGIAGNISVTANNSCGASSSSSKAITITSVPAQPGNITGNASPCVTTSSNYSIATVTNATSYTWTVPSGWTAIASIANTINAIPSATAVNGDITVVANNSCGASLSKSLAVTVGTVPAQPAAFTASPTVVCLGTSTTTATYTVPQGIGVTYNWSYSGTGASVQSGSTNTAVFNFPSSSTNGSVSVTATNSCGTSIARSIAVTVGTISQPGDFTTSTNIVCQGQSNFSYIVPNDPTATYAWTYSGSGTTVTAAVNTAILTFGAAATSGTLSVTATNNCGTGTARTIAITVTPTPAKPTITVDASSNGTQLIASSTTAGIYQWFKNGTSISSNGSTLVIDGAGSYTVKVTVNGCVGPLSDPQAMIVTGDILNDNTQSSVHPVPAHELLFVKGTALHSGNWGIINTQGRETRPPIQLMEDGSIINIGELTSGIYFLRANDGKKMVNIKFIKE